MIGMISPVRSSDKSRPGVRGCPSPSPSSSPVEGEDTTRVVSSGVCREANPHEGVTKPQAPNPQFAIGVTAVAMTLEDNTSGFCSAPPTSHLDSRLRGNDSRSGVQRDEVPLPGTGVSPDPLRPPKSWGPGGLKQILEQPPEVDLPQKKGRLT